jgi:hypothetical protein
LFNSAFALSEACNPISYRSQLLEHGLKGVTNCHKICDLFNTEGIYIER